METLVLKSRRARVLRGHPWVFAGELAKMPDPELDGQGARLVDGRGQLLGCGIVNTASKIVWRRYATEEVPWGAEALHKRLEKAIALRADDSVRRLVWAEADGLPGLVVDQFGKVAVVQALTLGMDRLGGDLAKCLKERLGLREVLFRNDAPARDLERMPREVGTASGAELEPFEQEIDGLVYRLDLANAQKTGYYLDQRTEHVRVGRLAKGRRVLDGCCNQGSFALQAARAGAREVLGVDSMAGCLTQARENAARNGLTVEFLEANLFDYLRLVEAGAFDLVVLDPPSFARSRSSVEGALRGYKELNLRALKLLPVGGVLATYSCSQHVSRELFEAVVAEAAANARRGVRLLSRTGQPADHPVLLNVPETEYLKGLVLEVVA